MFRNCWRRGTSYICPFGTPPMMLNLTMLELLFFVHRLSTRSEGDFSIYPGMRDCGLMAATAEMVALALFNLFIRLFNIISSAVRYMQYYCV
jgi:hypothetical protein